MAGHEYWSPTYHGWCRAPVCRHTGHGMTFALPPSVVMAPVDIAQS